jgi:hypothetical protein
MKLDNRTLMIIQKNEIYLIDIRNMMIKNKYKFINGEDRIKPLYNEDKNIYLNFENYTYIIRNNKYNLEVIDIIEKLKLSEIDKKEIEYTIKEQKYLLYHILKNPIGYKLSVLEKLESDSFSFEDSDDFFFCNRFLFSLMLFLNDYGGSRCEDVKIQIEEDMIEKRIGFKQSINYSIITRKNNYDKRSKLKKINEIKNERIRNNPKKFKKKFR